ncbi:hypothetical protein WG8_2969 [Paenibacillus sp. Aloe-11]|nr:hypothetical protein WG8_2969 [Paenibacillus sp. Aloe-11]
MYSSTAAPIIYGSTQLRTPASSVLQPEHP